jgi:hypothetical protein
LLRANIAAKSGFVVTKLGSASIFRALDRLRCTGIRGSPASTLLTSLPSDLGVTEDTAVKRREDDKPVIAKTQLPTQAHGDEIVPPHSGVEASDPEPVSDRL